MSTREHWQQVYATRLFAETSWYAPHLTKSLEWIREAASNSEASIIDVGGGEATLAGDLLVEGFRDVTVLDISPRALEKHRVRLGETARMIHWIEGDVTTAPLEPQRFFVWHDRAVFHFLVEPEQRRAYVRQLSSAIQRGGHVILATFGPEGPERCSGLPVRRYDAEALHGELGQGFRLIKSSIEQHPTPFGTRQQFLYCHFAGS
jgi:SAM-dependent methyltransferase